MSASPPANRTLRVMTYNLRYASEEGEHPWSARRPVMKELLAAAEPDVMGTQEGLCQQLRDIRADLGGKYEWIGSGRRGGSSDEYMAIFYRADRLRPLECEEFWISATPTVPGSMVPGAGSPRMVTRALFLDLATGFRFNLLNTHLDNRSERARQLGVDMLVDRLAGLPETRVITGDFNVDAKPGTPVYDSLLARGELVDSWSTAQRRGPRMGTWGNFTEPNPDGWRIDWILTSPDIRTESIEINAGTVDGRYASDHLPVQAIVEIRPTAERVR